MSGAKGRYFEEKLGAIDREKLLIVEGTDDQYFFDQMLHKIGADPERFGIIRIDGKDKLEESLRTLIMSSPFINGTIKKFSIVLDADDNPTARIRSVQRTLRDRGLPVPAAGSFQANGEIEVGLLIIPSATEPGNLETLCLNLLEKEKKYIDVNRFFIRSSKKYKIFNQKEKRAVQIYLALCKELCRGAGRGFKLGYIPFKRSKLKGVIDFLNLLAT